jgi:hypothetical protein
MPLEKIEGMGLPCMSPEHNVPMHIVLEPGTYRYTCPACGHVTVFEVPLIFCKSWSGNGTGHAVWDWT